MRAFAVQLGGRTGDYIKTIPAPDTHSEEQRPGTLDIAIIAFFLVCAGGLVYLALH